MTHPEDDTYAPDEAGECDDSKDSKKSAPNPAIPGRSGTEPEQEVAESQGGGIDGAIGGGQSGQGGG